MAEAVELQSKSYEPIKASMAIMKKNTAAIREACDAEPRTATEADRQKLVAGVQKLVSECNTNAMDTKKRLDAIDSDNRAFAKDNPGEGAEIGIRVNLHKQALIQFKGAMGEFHDVSGAFTKALQDTSRRQLQLVGVKEEDVEKVIASGKVQDVVRGAVLGSDQLDEVISDIEERHAAVMKLERSVREVQELFVQLATLVDVQSDSLQVIGDHVSEAKRRVEAGAEHVHTAEVYSNKSRKRTCFIAIAIVVVLIIIIAPTAAVLSKG